MPSPNFYPENIPQEMKDISQWVLWKLEELINGTTGEPEIDYLTGEVKLTKVPYQPNGKKADSTRQETWSSFEEALAAYNPSIYAGLGFVITKSTEIIAVDFDHVRHDYTSPVDGWQTKKWDEGVFAEIKDFNSYAEISQSGEGAHVFCKGVIPKAGRKKNNREMYSDSRFFAVTGDIISTVPPTINEAQECISDYYELWFDDSQSTYSNTTTCQKSPDMSDSEVLQHCRNEANAEKFNKLHMGDTSSYHSSSEAELAYCRKLAFYTQKQDQIDRIYRTSGLYNHKWDRRGKYTLEKAIINLPAIYQSKPQNQEEPFTVDPNSVETLDGIKELTADEIRARKESFKDRRLTLVLPPNHFVSIYRTWLSGITDGYEDYQTMGALWIISSFCNYNVNVRLKQETVRPNLSVTIFGRSTTSRKSTVVNRTRQVHESVTGSYLPNEDFSIEGYLESLSMNPTQHHVRDEVAGFLAKIHKQYNEGFNELECALYDGQNFRKTLAAKGNKEPKMFDIKSPYITKLYATTPDNYFKYMEMEDFLCGKEFRTLFVYPTYSKNKMALGIETQQDIDNWILVLKRAKEIYDFIQNSDGIEFKFEPGALEYYSEITSKIEDDADKADNSILSSAVGRSQIHILKLAMLLELGKEQISTTITKESLAVSANAIVTYFIPTLMDVVDLMQEDIKSNMIEKVVYVIRRRGGAIQHTKALHDSKLKSRDFSEVIETLIESETIEKVIETTSKKPYYILTELKKSLDLTVFQPTTKNLPNPQNLPSPLVSYDNTSGEILETLINVTQSDIARLEQHNTLPCEVRQSNNILSLQNLSTISTIRDGEIPEIREIKEIKTVNSYVVSVEEAARILDEEGIF
jgi:Uncharacterized conserved protein